MSHSPRALDAPWVRDWLVAQGHGPARIEPLTGDVSPRRYARIVLARAPSLILALYPTAGDAACRRFQRASELLSSHGVPVPAIVAGDCTTGLMLLEDLGEQTLYDLGELPWDKLEGYFETGIEIIRRIVTINAHEVAALNPPLDVAALRRELDQTWQLFLTPRGLTGGEPALLQSALDEVCTALGAAQPVPSHRDFMARNLMPLAGGPNLVVLDHQDLRLGPPHYDLASLLNDSLFPPPEVEERLLIRYGLARGERLDYHRAALQRTLKAIGTFVAFSRRGSRRHLALIPATLSRALHHLRQLPEAQDVVTEVEPRWRSVAEP